MTEPQIGELLQLISNIELPPIVPIIVSIAFGAALILKNSRHYFEGRATYVRALNEGNSCRLDPQSKGVDAKGAVEIGSTAGFEIN